MRHFAASIASASVFYHSAFASASRLAVRQNTPQTIDFKPCYDTNFECGVYEPPLDWANPSAGKAQIAVIRYNATHQPRLGPLFTNPGGPGGSGVQHVMDIGLEISNYTGGYYDIIGFDPRGVNNSFPLAHCFTTASEEDQLWNGTIQALGINSKGDFTDQADLDYFYSQTDSFDAKLRQFGQACKKNNENLKYIGTAAVVRDIVGMANILGGPNSPISYWGISYGTVIGAYLVNMFPERVGRIILDGVLNPTVYATFLPHKYAETALQDSELAFTGFCDQCAAGGVQCPISQFQNGTGTGTQVKARILQLIDNVYEAAKLGFGVRSSGARVTLFKALYFPRSWDETSVTIYNLEQAVTAFLASPSAKRSLPSSLSLGPQLRRASGKNPWEGRIGLGKRQTQSDDLPYDHAIELITCGDAVDATSVTTKDVFDEIVNVTHTLSPTFGASFLLASYYCHAYPVRAVERYTGPFNKKLANPILIIGNKADPITPYASAKQLADGFGDDAVLIERDGWGHYSGGMLSNCTESAISNYLISGKLPTADEFCQTNQPLFVEGTEPYGVDLASTVSPVVVPTGTGLSVTTTGASTNGTSTSSGYKVVMGSSALSMALFTGVVVQIARLF